MAIFYPGKDGDAMGSYVQGRFSKKQRREFAIMKQVEEEQSENEDYYVTQRKAMKYRDTVKKQRRDAGLE